MRGGTASQKNGKSRLVQTSFLQGVTSRAKKKEREEKVDKNKVSLQNHFECSGEKTPRRVQKVQAGLFFQTLHEKWAPVLFT